MAKSILDIIFKLTRQGNADKETIKGLIQVKSAMLEAAAVAGTMVAAGYTIKKVFDATVGTMVAYADQVRSISQLSGLTAEESSKLIQMTDDLKISFEDLQKVMQKNGDQYDFSAQGLAAMSDQYLALETSQEKAAFMQDRFGKSWGDFVELMEQGGDKIVKAADEINGALILDQEALDSAREYEKTLDNIQDDLKATQVALGRGFLKAADEVQEASAITEEAARRTNLNVLEGLTLTEKKILLAEVEKIKAEQALALANEASKARLEGIASLYGYATAAEESAAAVVSSYTDILGMTEKLFGDTQNYGEKVQAVNSDITLSEEERKVKLAELAAEHERVTNEIIADNLLQKLSVDGLTEAEFAMVVGFKESTGLLSAEAAAQALAIDQVTTAAANGALSVSEMKQAIDLLQSKEITLTVNQVTNIVRRDTLESIADRRAGYAEGTGGWVTVPNGYPNDSFPVWLESGEKFAVIPANSGGNVSMAGGMGGGGVNVTVHINSMVNTANREAMKAAITPAVMDAVRQMQAQGMV